MKCLNCGRKAKKNEEICPECGAYITKDTAKTKQEVFLNSNKDGSRKYIYSEHNYISVLLRIVGGGVLFVYLIIKLLTPSPIDYISKNIASTTFCSLLAAFIIFSGIASQIQEKNCSLTVTDENVSGIIPQGIFNTEKIDISIADIIAVNEEGFHSRIPNPEVHIVTKEKEYVIKGSSQSMLLNFSKFLKEKIVVTRSE